MDTIYNEILEKLEEYKIDGSINKLKAVNAVNCLFTLCQEYWQYQSKEFISVIPSLKDKISDYAENFNGKKTPKYKLTITNRLYIEFFYKAYLSCFGKNEETIKFFHDSVNKRKKAKEFTKTNISDILKTVFKPDTINETDVGLIKIALNTWKANVTREVYINELHMENLHRVMNILEKIFDSPNKILPDRKYSIEKTLTPTFLEDLRDCLNNNTIGEILVLFLVAPITRALYDGTPYSYTVSVKKNKGPKAMPAYIQKGIVHNYCEIENYYNAIKKLYDEYKETNAPLSDMWETLK